MYLESASIKDLPAGDGKFRKEAQSIVCIFRTKSSRESIRWWIRRIGLGRPEETFRFHF